MKSIVFIVEGPDDELFFRRVFIPILKTMSDDDFHVVTSKGFTAEDYRRQFAIYDEVIIVKDIDEDSCPTKKKNEICRIFNLHDKRDSICIVINEIESWYLAVGSQNLARLSRKFLAPNSTESFRKEDFDREMRSRYPKLIKHRTAILTELLKSPNIKSGASRNSSIKYFAQKVKDKTDLDLIG